MKTENEKLATTTIALIAQQFCDIKPLFLSWLSLEFLLSLSFKVLEVNYQPWQVTGLFHKQARGLIKKKSSLNFYFHQTEAFQNTMLKLQSAEIFFISVETSLCYCTAWVMELWSVILSYRVWGEWLDRYSYLSSTECEQQYEQCL